MPERLDLDEPISLHPLEGEDVLPRLLGVDANEPAVEDESEGDDES